MNQSAAAPRLSSEDVEAVVVGIDYHRFPGTTLTVCCLQLSNGHAVAGESACVSLANFDAQVGRDLARKAAIEKVWQLEGYLMRERIHQRHLMLARIDAALDPLTGDDRARELRDAFGQFEAAGIVRGFRPLPLRAAASEPLPEVMHPSLIETGLAVD